jgi:hypothetical protein
MTTISFPESPAIGTVFESGTRIWEWDGQAWVSLTPQYDLGPTGPTGVRGAGGVRGNRGPVGAEGPPLPIQEFNNGRALSASSATTLIWGNTFTGFDFTEPILKDTHSKYFQISTGVSVVNISLANGTFQKMTLGTGNTLFIAPTLAAGKKFILVLAQAAGGGTATWSGIKWPADAAPTITATASKVDIFEFYCDGLFWYASILGQNF